MAVNSILREVNAEIKDKLAVTRHCDQKTVEGQNRFKECQESLMGLFETKLREVSERSLTQAADIALQYGIRMVPAFNWERQNEFPKYRCESCQISWFGARADHPRNAECQIEDAIFGVLGNERNTGL